MEFLEPNRPIRCTWTPNATNTPHSYFRNQMDKKKILPNVLEAMGDTPMIRLNKIPKLHGIECEMLVKCEFLNPGGSVKDRIAFRIVKEAEEKGLIKPGYTLIEASSGNTGIAAAMVASVKGYKCIIIMPSFISSEKQAIIEALGGQVLRCPMTAAWDGPEGVFAVAERLNKEIPTSFILNQFTNTGNALAHYDTTGMEIFEQTEGKIDYLVAGSGTGGTLTGIARKLKELSPETKIVGVDPEGSVVAEPPELNDPTITWEMEGIGYFFVPTSLDRRIIDFWIKSNDRDSFLTARSLIHDEGLLVGGSSGAIMSSAIKVAKKLPKDKRVVVLLPDGIRNYLTKFVSDDWMEYHGFIDPPKPIEKNRWWWNLPVSKMELMKPISLRNGATCRETIDTLEKSSIHQIPILVEKNKVKGIITLNEIESNLIQGQVDDDDPVESIMLTKFPKLENTATLGRLSRILKKEKFTIILNNDEFVGVARQRDLLNFIKNDDNH